MPRGTIGAEVRVTAPGDPSPILVSPTDPGELTFLLVGTATPSVAAFTRPDPDILNMTASSM